MSERAKKDEKTKKIERAEQQEETLTVKRAIVREKPTDWERLSSWSRSIRAGVRALIQRMVYTVRKWRIEYLRGHAYEGRRVDEYVNESIRFWRRYERRNVREI